ncbi:MAG: hypothetical protein KKB88_05895 [Nanoarchaeota archaeon]|nr:hypothetical protein [Nanoarchaeota archaeon]
MTNKCKKCGYEWESKIDNPVSCPRCKRYDWNENQKKDNESHNKLNNTRQTK